MIRLNMIVEGQTEETFVRDVLSEHLFPFQIYPAARRVETGRKRISGARDGSKRIFRGGMTTYQKVRRDILRWIRQEEDSREVYVTTMFDSYALPSDFPEYEKARAEPTPLRRVAAMEEAFGRDIGFPRFIPYIQLHEFEALVLVEPARIAAYVQKTEADPAIRNLLELSRTAPPEEIDDGEQTSPAKRIIREIPEYEGLKSIAGPLIVGRIGLPAIRRRCPHFDRWLSQLETLHA